MKPYLLFITLFYTIPAISQDPAWQQKVSPRLLSVSDKAPESFLIVMTDQADLSEAIFFETKEEKGSYVFNTLSAFARESQKSILSFLDSQNVPYHSLHVVNAIYCKGDLYLIQTLAERKDVKRVSFLDF